MAGNLCFLLTDGQADVYYLQVVLHDNLYFLFLAHFSFGENTIYYNLAHMWKDCCTVTNFPLTFESRVCIFYLYLELFVTQYIYISVIV